MSDNMKWPEKMEEYIGPNDDAINYIAGWNVCLDECKRLNQPAEQCEHEVKSTDCICIKCGKCLIVPGCECASEPRLAPLDKESLRDILEFLVKNLPDDPLGRAGAVDGTVKRICQRFGTSQLEPKLELKPLIHPGYNAVIDEMKRINSEIEVSEPCQHYWEYLKDYALCVKCNKKYYSNKDLKSEESKAAQPKEVKLSVEELAKIIKANYQQDSEEGYLRLATIILNFLNARGEINE